MKKIALKRLRRKIEALKTEALMRDRITLSQHMEECLWLITKVEEDDQSNC